MPQKLTPEALRFLARLRAKKNAPRPDPNAPRTLSLKDDTCLSGIRLRDLPWPVAERPKVHIGPLPEGIRRASRRTAANKRARE